jgi:ligand-binding sensor domain-containing protein
MKNDQKKIGKVMREFKRGELNIGQSSKKVKNPKQAIAIALSEAGQSRKPMAKGGSVNSTSRSEYGNLVDHSQFLNSDGYAQAVDVEVSNPQETQLEQVGGQRRMLPDKKRKAKWY